jgi:hypothetical protein
MLTCPEHPEFRPDQVGKYSGAKNYIHEESKNNLMNTTWICPFLTAQFILAA